MEQLLDLRLRDRVERAWLTVATPSFIAEAVASSLANDGDLRAVRALVLAPAAIDALASASVLDAAVTVGRTPDLPGEWSSARLGEIHYGLFASPSAARALGASPSTSDVLRHRFVVPVYVSGGALVQGDDRCPFPISERKVAHEVESIRLACRLAAETDDLVYGPVLAAAPFVAAGALVHVDAPGWASAERVHFACNAATIRSTTQHTLAAAVQGVLVTSVRPSGIVTLPGADAVGRTAKG